MGFRPFIYRLANEHGLSGRVLNDSCGVVVEAQGSAGELDGFIADIRERKPVLAIIQRATMAEIPPRAGERGFTIEQSDDTQPGSAGIAPDLATCPQCLADVHNPGDKRRYHYALTNCTACGPRFSIVRAVPYDRANTTMSAFGMCEECRREFKNPADRRFHAQPTACHVCGPKVALVDSAGMRVPGESIATAAERLLAGEVVAIQGIGGFHLAVRADDSRAVEKLRGLKHRPSKPFALMTARLDNARRIVTLTDRGAEHMASSAAPIVLGPRRGDAAIVPAVAPGNQRLGVMLAYSPLHHLLFDRLHERCPALVMTSANDNDEPLIYTHEEAQARLGPMCAAILRHDRPIHRPVDDSVLLDVPGRQPILLRRSRGYVPTPLALPVENATSGVCVGGDLKNTVAVVRGGEVVLSQHLGDLGNARTYAAFKRALADLLELLQVQPQWVAHDLHPGYVSTMYARQLAVKLGIPAVPVQHHHAHAAAVLAEHGRTGPALAVVCDGTGFGTDTTMWGGELIVADLKRFGRIGRIKPMRLPGGDAASRQAWRCAMSLLFNAFGSGFGQMPIVSRMVEDAEQAIFVEQMLRTGTGCIWSSAAGRLFDGMAALLGLANENRFEAEAPMALESAAAVYGKAPPATHPLFEIREKGSIEIDLAPMVRYCIVQLDRGMSAQELAAIFHDQFAAAWEAAILLAVERTRLTCVAFSGGVMCNQIVDELLAERLRQRGLHVLQHRLVPPNDGGLAFGQAALAAGRAVATPGQATQGILSGRS